MPLRGAYEVINGKKVYESQRRAKRAYKQRYKDKVNAQRRSRRYALHKEQLGIARCNLCEIYLRERPTRSIKYCSGCRANYPTEIRSKQRRALYGRTARTDK